LAKDANYGQVMIGMIEPGERKPDGDKLALICQLLEIDIDSLPPLEGPLGRLPAAREAGRQLIDNRRQSAANKKRLADLEHKYGGP